MKISRIVAGAALLAACGTAMADGFRGNVGAVSEYMFRGIEGSQGAAIQGELYHSWDNGFYVGGWITNARSASNKVDAYAGYETRIGPFAVGGGGVYRLYTEDEEHGTFNPAGGGIDFPELFVTGAFGPASLTVYYTNDYFGTDRDAIYITGDVLVALTDTINLIGQAGFNSGDGVEFMRGEEYMDYGVSMEKKLERDLTVSFQLLDTDREFASGVSDDPKFVVGLRKDFVL
jgi:uncharacterized protein (TIGR02001 family)